MIDELKKKIDEKLKGNAISEIKTLYSGEGCKMVLKMPRWTEENEKLLLYNINNPEHLNVLFKDITKASLRNKASNLRAKYANNTIKVKRTLLKNEGTILFKKVFIIEIKLKDIRKEDKILEFYNL